MVAVKEKLVFFLRTTIEILGGYIIEALSGAQARSVTHLLTFVKQQTISKLMYRP